MPVTSCACGALYCRALVRVIAGRFLCCAFARYSPQLAPDRRAVTCRLCRLESPPLIHSAALHALVVSCGGALGDSAPWPCDARNSPAVPAVLYARLSRRKVFALSQYSNAVTSVCGLHLLSALNSSTSMLRLRLVSKSAALAAARGKPPEPVRGSAGGPIQVNPCTTTRHTDLNMGLGRLVECSQP